MISGSVTPDLDAVISVTLQSHDGWLQLVDAVLDTGFNGALTLPAALALALGFTLVGQGTAILADGSEHLFDFYEGAVVWDGQPRPVVVSASNTEPLVGMEMLRNHDLQIQVVDGGDVAIRRL